jgi:transposase InsO family protein
VRSAHWANCSPRTASNTGASRDAPPKRNGKVERYRQTLAHEWAYGQTYRSSRARAAALPHWLEHSNRTGRHSAIGNRPPISRVRKHPKQDN